MTTTDADARRHAAARFHFQTRNPETEPQFDLCLREWTPDPRPAGPARHHEATANSAADVFPVVLLFLELPTGEVDVNVHPSKTEVRFRQQTLVHDFVRESVRAALMKARPVPQFTREIRAQPTASAGLSPGARRMRVIREFALRPEAQPPVNERLQFAERRLRWTPTWQSAALARLARRALRKA